MVKKTLLVVLLLFMATPVTAGEYYQYRDDKGNLRFTDDLSTVPEKQRSEVKTFESIKGNEVRKAAVAGKPVSSSELTKNGHEDSDDSGAWVGKIKRSSEELDEMQAELEQTAQTLKQQQKELEAQAPGKEATDNEESAYYEKVNALNEKIEAYNKRREKFNQKVKAFNRAIGRETNEN